VSTVFSLALPGLLAFGGAALGHLLTRRSSVEQREWSKRAEALGLLRWASELALSGDPDRRQAGVAALKSLSRSSLLSPDDYDFLVTMTGAAPGTEERWEG